VSFRIKKAAISIEGVLCRLLEADRDMSYGLCRRITPMSMNVRVLRAVLRVIMYRRAGVEIPPAPAYGAILLCNHI
jgi:hypothetical protein